MSNYYKLLAKHIDENPLRVFANKCPECKKVIFSVDEKTVWNDEDKKIVAKFICPKCNKKFIETMVDFNDKPSRYKCEQVMVNKIKKNKKETIPVIYYNNKVYKVLEDKIIESKEK